MENIIGQLSYRPNILMSFEILIWLIVFFVIYKNAVRNTSFRTSLVLFVLFIAYIHRILLPFIGSSLYILAVVGIISVIGRLRLSAFLNPFKYVVDKLLLYTDREKRSRTEILFFFAFLTIVLIQLSRINIAMDYDSLRYGLRSDYVLTGGRGLRGFFENNGFVNMVYSYPKGFEFLTLPLCSDKTYGYVLCVNIWLFAASSVLTGMIASEITDKKQRLHIEIIVLGLVSLIPGISNMAVTAKTDIITAFLQLIFIYSIVKYLKTENEDYVGIGLFALLLSYTMKPTAYIFSTLIGMTGFLYLIKNRVKIRFNGFGIRLITASVLFFGMIMLRTYIISGLPVAGVFTDIFEQLGFELRYPLTAPGMPSGKADSFLDNLLNALIRIFLFLFFPAGEDMDHVRIAWGGFVFAILLLFVLGRKRTERKSLFNDKTAAYIFINFYVILVLSVITLFLLYQVDGNYYTILYQLTVISASTAFYKLYLEEKSSCKENVEFIRGGHKKIEFGILSVFMVFVTAFSGWAGAVGFTPVDFINRGYYNHSIEYGFENPLGLNAADRVVAFAPEPECYKIMAGVESFVDIDGSGGNVLLTDTKLNIFKEYCCFADIDYIYVDADWLNDETNQRHVRAKTLFTYMLEDGDFSDIYITSADGKKAYFKVDKERMSVPWEEEMSDSLKKRIEEQSIIFKELIE